MLRLILTLALSSSLSMPTLTAATTCIDPGLKPISHLCGVVLDVAEFPLGKTKVTVLKDDNEVAAFETKDDGEFNFPQFSAGHYEVEVSVAELKKFRFAIVIKHPNSSCKKKLRIKPIGIYCGEVLIIKK